MVISGLAGAACIWLALKYGAAGWTPATAAVLLLLAVDAGLYLLLAKKGAEWLAAISA